MDIAIHVENLTVAYENTVALKNVCLDVHKGEFLAIMGPNGGGKSTLLKSILGLIPVSAGKIEILGKPVKKCGAEISYVPQFANVDRKFPISAVEVVMTSYIRNGLHPFFRYKKEDKQKAIEQMKYVGIDDLAGRQISELSGGEFQRLLIARAMAVNPQILILDEPTASVDPSSREKIYDVLDKLNKEKNMTIIMVTHDLSAISSDVTRLACLNETLVYHGEPKLTESVVNHLYGCPVDLIAHGVPHRVLKEHDGEDE